MSYAISLVELLAQLAGAELSFRQEDEDDLLAVTVLVLPTRRQVLFVERTYRDGTRVLLDPTSEELESARSGNLWSLWNEERTQVPGSSLLDLRATADGTRIEGDVSHGFGKGWTQKA